MKLGKRLQQINAMISHGYEHIWDTCCDHGLLGAALLKRNAAPNIHFVDIVPELIAELEVKLHKFCEKLAPTGSATTWHTQCLDSAALRLDLYSGKHLVIIAGIGGDLTQQIITSILQNHSAIEIDFLICPVHHEYSLRQQLIQMNCSLINETLVKENQRIYEILFVSTSKHAASKPIHPVGSLLWQAKCEDAIAIRQQYLKTRIQHYQRQTRNNAAAKKALAAYQSVLF
ncbi:Putative SAM-dependent methyltransferase [Idiomarina sp. A28L]|uniref:tRNA (adenine(22)-N(1))-methyltransferase n=1 Tax=Idiomarina sp. A28L TaxID=1036674 RepID=UPI00021386CF|nr:tRNA (adenine(22)-N(1))-methyltransferase TrmK [Idiomarina sp. A28L]EGN75632.1 Putative SAM-dependent methyltransferase [Idiomarina sp. A28L]